PPAGAAINAASTADTNGKSTATAEITQKTMRPFRGTATFSQPEGASSVASVSRGTFDEQATAAE
ncbi:hypothetical protein LSAT2_014969, partial [Lamellibrachia satsuma]